MCGDAGVGGVGGLGGETGATGDATPIGGSIGLGGSGSGGGGGMDASSNSGQGDHVGFGGDNVGSGLGFSGQSATGEVGVASVGFGAGNAPGDSGGIGVGGVGFGDGGQSLSGMMGDEASIMSAFDQSLTPSNTDVMGSDQDVMDAINQAFSNAQQSQNPSEAAQSFFDALGSLISVGLAVTLGKFGDVVVGLAGKLGINSESAAAAFTGLMNGDISPGDVSFSGADFGGEGATGGGPATSGTVDTPGGGGGGGITGGGTGGGGGGDVVNNDPLSYDFWNNFVDEWMGKNSKSAKTMYGEDDAFKKSKVEPAIGKYQAALADLTNQAQTGTGTFTPTTFGMGDFRSSFVPKSGHLTADKLKDYAKENLTSSLALTDVMQPNKGSMDYLDQLKALAMFDKEAQLKKYGIDMGYNTAIDSIQEGNEDKGSWLDIVKDVVQIGDTVGDAWTKYF